MMEEAEAPPAEQGSDSLPMSDLTSSEGNSDPVVSTFPDGHPPRNAKSRLKATMDRYMPNVSTWQRIKSCCSCCSTLGTNRILPVTTVPSTCDYLEIRPNRRIRVIHIHDDIGFHDTDSAPDTRVRFSSETSEDEDYWFENASPKRLPIQPPPPTKPNPKRIINKLEPQERPKILGLGINGATQSRSGTNEMLPRKKIISNGNENFDDDDDDENFVFDEQIDGGLNANAASDASDIFVSIPADEGQNHQPPREGSPTPDEDTVIQEPDPDPDKSDSISPSKPLESKSDDVHASKIAGSNLGGRANIGFDAEEDVDVSDPDPSPEKKDGHEHDDTAQGHHDSTDTAYVEHKNESEFMPTAPISSDQAFETKIRDGHCETPGRPVIFFIHGIGGSANTWNSQIDYFSRLGFEIVAPDLLGHGFSSVPDKAKCYTFKKLLRDILIIFDHYVLVHAKTCVVIAHSYGCSFATALSRSRPNNVLMLLLLSCGGPSPLSPPPIVKSIPSTVLMNALKPFFMCSFRRQQQYNPKGKAMKFEEAFDVPHFVFKHMMAGQIWPEGDAGFHRRIRIPVLLVHGLKDPFVPLVEMCEMERTIPKSFLEVIPLASHMIMLDQPKELNVMMKKFILKYLAKEPQRHRMPVDPSSQHRPS